MDAVELTRARNENARHTSRDMLVAVVADVEQRVSRLRLQKVLDLRFLHQKFVGLMLLVLGVFVAWRVEPQLASIWAQRNLLLLRDVNWPKLVHLQLVLPESNPIVVAVGDDVLLLGGAELQLFVNRGYGNFVNRTARDTGRDFRRYLRRGSPPRRSCRRLRDPTRL